MQPICWFQCKVWFLMFIADYSGRDSEGSLTGIEALFPKKRLGKYFYPVFLSFFKQNSITKLPLFCLFFPFVPPPQWLLPFITTLEVGGFYLRGGSNSPIISHIFLFVLSQLPFFIFFWVHHLFNLNWDIFSFITTEICLVECSIF